MNEREEAFAIRHAQDAYRILKDYGCQVHQLHITEQGLLYKDYHGSTVLMDKNGDVIRCSGS
jgi:hypothetical protein